LRFSSSDRQTNVNRLEALTDGVFSIAITLLVLTIRIPEPGEIVSQRELIKYILSLDYELFSYCISFFVVGSLWISGNKRMKFLRKTDDLHLWLSLVSLLFITLIPLTTSLLSDYGDFEFVELLFHGNILMLEIIALIEWEYLIRKTDLVQEEVLGKLDIRNIRMKNLFSVFVPVFGMLISVLTPAWSNLVYLLLFFRSLIIRH
jgi:uncharacterized membrane protein